MRDDLAAERRELPWVKVDESLRLRGPERPARWPTCSAAGASSWSITS